MIGIFLLNFWASDHKGFFQTYIDSAINPIGDFAKLYWHFYRSQGSGLAGIFITLFLYTCIAFIVSSILYMYFLRWGSYLHLCQQPSCKETLHS